MLGWCAWHTRHGLTLKEAVLQSLPSKRELAEAVEAYEEAKLAWAALNRNTQHKGVHELLDA